MSEQSLIDKINKDVDEFKAELAKKDFLEFIKKSGEKDEKATKTRD